jgi:DNA-binding beta-propeller fold protein YncE
LTSLGPPPGGSMSLRADHSRSRMARDAKNTNLLYISDAESGDLYVYSYPQAKLKGTLTGLSAPEGECVDKAGDVFVANTGATDILEYAHGGTTPIATLSDSGYYPVGCAVDPTTGNLAVTNICMEEYGQCIADGNLLIYAGAKGTPKSYTDSGIAEYFFCGYDDTGNLYVDGLYNSNFAFGELPRGRSSFRNITLNTFIYQPGGVQWDGKYVAVGNEDLYNNIIYEFRISGAQGKLARPGGTPLDGATLVVQFWIQDKAVIGPNHGGSGSVMFWKYPGGGSPTKVLNAFSTPIGSTVSMANS